MQKLAVKNIYIYLDRPEKGKDESLQRPDITMTNRNTQPNEPENNNDWVCRCGRMFKTRKWVLIHQSNTKCLEKQQHCTARISEAGNAEEIQDPEKNHITTDKRATNDKNEERRNRIK